MTTIRHELRAACAPERVWRLLADLEAVAHYNPGVRAARIEGPRRLGVGAERSCELHPKGRVLERVTHWQEDSHAANTDSLAGARPPGFALGLEVVESDWPIRSMRWVTRVEAADGGSVIRQELEYAPKFGWLGWLLDRLVLRRTLTRSLDRVLASLIASAEANP